MREPWQIFEEAQYHLQKAAKELSEQDSRLAVDLSRCAESTLYSMQRHALNQWGVTTEPQLAPEAPAVLEPAKKKKA